MMCQQTIEMAVLHWGAAFFYQRLPSPSVLSLRYENTHCHKNLTPHDIKQIVWCIVRKCG